MPSFQDMQKIYGNVTLGQRLKENSDLAIQLTFDNDLATRQCYIYDYYHDDQKELRTGYDPSLSKTKTPVKLKFIVKEYKSLSKDDPEAHIMFEPDVWNSQSCIPDYFTKEYEKYDIQFPIGLFVDIPDDRGVYWKWLICYAEPANQNPKFGVIKCNYQFMWIENSGANMVKRKIWGAERTQNSYTSGIWTGDKATVYDEQGKFWISWNSVTRNLRHDMRLIISMLQPDPFCYVITKIKNTAPKGIITVTLKQDLYNPQADYVNLQTGEMFADYYRHSIIPSDENLDSPEDSGYDMNKDNAGNGFSEYTLEIRSTTLDIGMGYKKKMFALVENHDKNIVDIDYEKLNWEIYIDNEDISEDSSVINYVDAPNNELYFTLVKNEEYAGKVLNVICSYTGFEDKLVANKKFNITY